MKKRSLPAVILILHLSAFAMPQTLPKPKTDPPQQPAAQQPTSKPSADDDVVKISTNLVQVDAVVNDKSGKPVTDLKADEFQIFEDGRQQKITHFSYVVADSSIPAPATKRTKQEDRNAVVVPSFTITPEQVRRTIALVVDDLGLSFESMYYVQHALKKFVDEQMQPGD